VFDQIPKRLGGRLGGNPDRQNYGWGVYFKEDYDWDKILAVELIGVVLGSLLFGLLWSILKQDMQGAFSVATYWLTTWNVLLACIARQFQ
jgi:hypothetical protein